MLTKISKALSRYKKEVKKSSPLGVLIEIELSNMKALTFFSTFNISEPGIFNLVSPKNKLLELKLDLK